MPRNALVRCWLTALLASAVITTVAYVLVSPEFQFQVQIPLLWLLWPGVWLYIQANGSLVFGGGFGTYGNAAIIIVGSAVGWSVPLAILFWRLKRNG